MASLLHIPVAEFQLETPLTPPHGHSPKKLLQLLIYFWKLFIYVFILSVSFISLVLQPNFHLSTAGLSITCFYSHGRMNNQRKVIPGASLQQSSRFIDDTRGFVGGKFVNMHENEMSRI